MKKLLTLLPLLLLAFPATAEARLSKKEKRQLLTELSTAMKSDDWNAVGSALQKLSADNTKKTWRLMVKVVEKSPPRYDLHVVLRRAAETMTDRSVQKEIKNTVKKSRSSKVRMACVLHLAKRQEWDALITALKDKEEDVAALAAWKLIDNRVEDAIDPMINLLEKLEKSRAGIWDVLRNGLGRVLGGRLNMAMEYRSRWLTIQEQGGLKTVKAPSDADRRRDPNRLKSGVRLFGRDIDCTRVVFILDVSGSMSSIDPDQKDYDDEDQTSRSRGGKDAGPSGGRKKPVGKTRLQRAQRALKKVISNLPANYKINIVAYSSRVKIWRGEDGDNPAKLHGLKDATRKAAIKFVQDFQADGVTATDTALLRAYTIEGARCFYLLSDGMATHDGTTPVPLEDMIEVLDSHKDQHVTVHTLGFKGADREMMKALAKHTGGKYSDIQ